MKIKIPFWNEKEYNGFIKSMMAKKHIQGDGNMKKRIIVFIMILSVLLALGVGVFHYRRQLEHEQAAPKQGVYETTLRVVSDVDYEPIAFLDENGKPAGHDVELVYAIGERLGVNIELEMMRWPEALEAFETGEYDLLISGAYSPKRTGWVEYSTPVMNEAYLIFGRDMKNFSISQLFGAKISTMSSDDVKEAIVEAYELEATIYYQPDYRSCFEMLAEGGCDYVIAPESIGTVMLDRLDIDDVETAENVVYNAICCIGIRKENQKLVEEVNRILGEMDAEGKLAEMHEYWLYEYIGAKRLVNVIKEEPELFALFVLGAVFLISAITFYYETKRARQTIERMEQERELNRLRQELDVALRRERQQYREALLYDCIRSYNIDLTDGVIYKMQKGELPHSEPVDFPVHNDVAVKLWKEYVKPVMLFGTLEEQSVEHYLSEYEKGKRLLEFEYYVPDKDTYVRKTVFLSKDEENGHVLACVVAKDVSDLRKEEYENKRGLQQLTEAAERIAAGDLEVEIRCQAGGDIAVLADSLQKTVEELKKRIQYINNLAYIDLLTGTANSTAYRKMMEELNAALNEEQNLRFGVVMFDLNGLKRINDTLGHRSGDLFIQTAAKHIQDSFPNGTIYRVGGDEFVALVTSSELEQLEQITEHFEQKLEEYNRNQTEFPDGISVAVGFARFDANVDHCYKDVFQRADERMYRDKNRQKGEGDSI